MFAVEMTPILTLLVQIAVILAVARLMGLLVRLMGQPQVVGEMAGGIMLGPSVLGLIHGGAWMHALFPKESLSNLDLFSKLGVMLFMFLVGLELDPKLLRGQGKAALVTGTVGILIPLITGATLGILLLLWAPEVTGETPSALVLCLFMGTAMSITAFPVLARILTERNLHKTKSGALALTCAAMDDVMGWCLLAFVLAVAHMKGFGNDAAHAATMGAAHTNPAMTLIRTLTLTAVYVTLMLFVVRRLLAHLQAHFESRGYMSQDVLAVVFLLLIASSVTTDVIGIHQIFGAFMLGAVMPKDGAFIRHLAEKVEDFAILFLLPLFFAYTGLQTQLGLLASGQMWGICGIVILTAIVGKFGGVCAAARWYGMNWRQSSLLGVLMNTRGLMELIILNIGLSFHVLSPQLFAMMVLMALVTTFMTAPLMRLLYSPERQRTELEEAARDDAERVAGLHVVVPVSLRSTAGSLVKMASMLMAGDPGRIYAMHLDRPEEMELRSQTVLQETDRVLETAQSAAREYRVPINAVSFVSKNIGRDIADAARRYRASWVVMGWHKAIFFKNVLGGTVGQILENAPANVGIFIDKGQAEMKRILVPYLGEVQDRGALMAAERLARMPGVQVTILHVVKPNRADGDTRMGVQSLVEKEFPGTAGHENVRMRIVESESPADLVVEESYRYDLMILGIADQWNLQGKNESVAQLANCSLLVVHANPLAPVVQTESADKTVAAT